MSNKLLPRFPITTHEITNDFFNFIPDIPGVRLKIARNKPSSVYTEEYVTVTEYLYKIHKCLTLKEDVMFINWNVFMITSETKRYYVTVEHIKSHTLGQLSKSLNN